MYGLYVTMRFFNDNYETIKDKQNRIKSTI